MAQKIVLRWVQIGTVLWTHLLKILCFSFLWFSFASTIVMIFYIKKKLKRAIKFTINLFFLRVSLLSNWIKSMSFVYLLYCVLFLKFVCLYFFAPIYCWFHFSPRWMSDLFTNISSEFKSSTWATYKIVNMKKFLHAYCLHENHYLIFMNRSICILYFNC